MDEVECRVWIGEGRVVKVTFPAARAPRNVGRTRVVKRRCKIRLVTGRMTRVQRHRRSVGTIQWAHCGLLLVLAALHCRVVGVISVFLERNNVGIN